MTTKEYNSPLDLRRIRNIHVRRMALIPTLILVFSVAILYGIGKGIRDLRRDVSQSLAFSSRRLVGYLSDACRGIPQLWNGAVTRPE